MEIRLFSNSLKFIPTLVFAFLMSFSVVRAANVETVSVTEVESSNQEVNSQTEEEKGFDITSFIFHHIADAHSFTIIGSGEDWVGIHLPVILYTPNGFVTFSNSEFQMDEEAKVVVDKKGQKFVKYHGKIYYANDVAEEGKYVTYDADHKVANVRPLDLSITKNVFTILLSFVVLLWVFLSVAKGYKKRQGKAPKGLQSFIEPLILFVRDEIARPNLGHKYEKFMPYLLTVFFFIWFNNMLGLVPFFPGSANVTGNIAVTMVLAIITLLIILFNGNKNYWGHIFNPPVPWWLKPLLVPVEIFGIFTKPAALAIRLFANITAGHILVLSLLCLVFIFNSLAIVPASVIFVMFITLIEFLVAFIQAFIFTMLSALFIGMAIEDHH